MNKIEKKITEEKSCRFLYANGAFAWFIGGATEDPVLQEMVRYRVMRDFETLTRLCDFNEVPVALLTDTMAAPIAERLITAMPKWGSVRFGKSDLDVENADLVCALSADIIISYGEPTDRLYELLNERDEEKYGPAPEVIVRDIHLPIRVKQTVESDPDPYARYWGDVNRMRKWRRIPSRGLQTRDMVDMRPKWGRDYDNR